MLPWNLRRQLRRLPSFLFLRQRVRRPLITLIRLLAITMVFLVAIAFVTPARNFVGYYFLPSSLLQLSSGRIIQMFLIEEQRVPVETGDVVTCADVESVLGTVDWDKIISELPNFPVYDDQYYKNLASNPDTYGATPEDVELLTERLYNYKPPMPALWQKRLRLTFKVLSTAMDLFNVSYFLSEGSMLGAYRHHGFIPWDDDMDVCMNGTDWLKVKQILHCIPGFDVDTRSYMMYKFFWKNSEPMKNDPIIHIPYIDIFFFTEDEDYMWALSSIKKHRIVFRKTEIFPLIRRPFEDQMAPLPRTFENLCKTMYDPTICVSRDFDHFKDRPLIPFYEYEYRPCHILKKYYPFVDRVNVTIQGKPATIETKKLGKKILSNFTVFH